MKKDVMVSFKSFNKYEEDNSDKMEFLTRGSFFEKDGKYYLKYEEKNENDSVTTTMKIEDNKVTIIRFGASNTQMIVEQGKKHLNYYETPHGAFTIGVYSDKVDINIGEKEGNIRLNYDVEFNNAIASRNTIKVDFKEVQ